MQHTSCCDVLVKEKVCRVEFTADRVTVRVPRHKMERKNSFSSDPTTKKTYHGLVNQGATCYLNSVLQALFMTTEYRDAVEGYANENPETEYIDRHLASLFGDLRERTAYTFKITQKLGIDRVYEQRDAAEYFEKILNLTSPQASEIFRGQLTHKTICSACGESTDTDGAFWHLPLALVDSFSVYSVVNGIDEYFRDAYFRGENQMYCDHCDDKCDGTIKCEIKRYPDVLMLLLKRFEFNYDYMTYVKINCPVDVPCSLQIPQNQTYELYAVVDHCGDLRSGHYTARIKPHDEKWHTFNDERVTTWSYQPLQNIDRSKSAYLLFYRKKSGRTADTPGVCSPVISDMQDQCQDSVKMKEREDVKQKPVVGNDTVLIKNEETGTKDAASDQYIAEGLPSHLSYNAQDQGNKVYANESRPNDHQGRNEEKNDLHSQGTLTQNMGDTGKSIRDEEEGEQKRESTAKGSVMKNTSYNDQRHEQEVINMPARSYCPQQVKQRDGEKVVVDINAAMDGNMEEQSQRREKASEHQDSEGLSDVRQYMCKEPETKHKVEQDYGLKPDSVDKREGEEKMDIDVKLNKEIETGADDREMASRSPKLLTKYDLYYSEVRSSGRGVSQQNRPKDDQRSEQRSSQWSKRCEQGGPGVARQAEKTEYNEYNEDRAASSRSKAGLAASRGLIETRQGHPQPKGRTGSNGDQVGVITYYGKIIDEEFRETPGGTQRSSKTTNIRIETVKEPSQGGIKSKLQYDDDPKMDAKVTLTSGVRSLKINESPSPEAHTRRGKTQIDAQVQAGMRRVKEKSTHRKRRRWESYSSPMKEKSKAALPQSSSQSSREKKKKKQSTGCFSLFQKRRKNAEHTSELD